MKTTATIVAVVFGIDEKEKRNPKTDIVIHSWPWSGQQKPLVKIQSAQVVNIRSAATGQDQKTKKWARIDTYGGRLVENMCQAVARDCMAEAMLRLRDAGYQTRMTVHDEIIAEMPLGVGSVQEVETLMGAAISWADGLPLKGNGFETTYYRKD